MVENIFQLINETVPIHDLLDSMGVKYASRERNLKISCPFHGLDNQKSAFVYTDTNSVRCFTCNESWDVVAFYAQANELWKPGPEDEDVLDMGRAIAGLKEEYGITYERPAWEVRFRELKGLAKPPQGYEDFRQVDREQISRLYLWGVSRDLAPLTKEARAEQWENVRTLFNDLEDLDLGAPSWKHDLNCWHDRAKLVVGGTYGNNAANIST